MKCTIKIQKKFGHSSSGIDIIMTVAGGMNSNQWTWKWHAWPDYFRTEQKFETEQIK